MRPSAPCGSSLAGAHRFVADRMLGKLSRLLRMLGHDVLWIREGSREAVALVASEESRCLLTRDRALARRVDNALFVEHAYPFHQARQVLRAFRLDDARAFTRCVEDNGELVSASRAEVQGEVPRKVLNEASCFYRCNHCGKVYWPGSHVERMRTTILALLEAPLPIELGDPVPEGARALGRLEPLLDLHQAMDAMFWAHRVALLRGELGPALGQLRKFAMNMARHVDLEDQLVLPVYASAAPKEGFPRGGGPDIFRRDHEKILDDLQALENRAENLLREGPGESRDLGRLELLDAERRYVDLLAHHDHRERAFLYPRLEEILTADEQSDLLTRMLGSLVDSGRLRVPDRRR